MRVSDLESTFEPSNDDEINNANKVNHAHVARMDHRCVGVGVAIGHSWIGKPVALHDEVPSIELLRFVEAPVWRLIERQHQDEKDNDEVAKWH